MHTYMVSVYLREMEYDFRYSNAVRDSGVARGVAFCQAGSSDGFKAPQHLPREPVVYYVDDENEAGQLAKVLAEKHPGVSVLVATVKRAFSCPPGQLRVSEVSEKGLLPNKGI